MREGLSTTYELRGRQDSSSEIADAKVSSADDEVQPHHAYPLTEGLVGNEVVVRRAVRVLPEDLDLIVHDVGKQGREGVVLDCGAERFTVGGSIDDLERLSRAIPGMR